MDLSWIEQAKKEGATFLSEHESKRLLAQFGAPVPEELLTRDAAEALVFAAKVGFPVALKGCGRTLLHKTEEGMVALGIDNEPELKSKFAELLAKLPGDAQGILVAPMVDNRREFIAGLSIDPGFGPVVMFGLGGIFTEALKDVAFRVAPLETIDARELIDSVRSKNLLGEVRGLPAVDTDELEKLLVAIGRVATEIEGVTEIDCNPVLFQNGRPVVADALIRIGN